MDRVITKEYIPSIDEQEKYFDYVGTWTHSMKCVCGCRGEGVYETKAKFSAHCRTKCHQKWLDVLTQSNEDYYKEVIELRKLAQEQAKKIRQLLNSLSTKTADFDSLLERLEKDFK